MDRSDWLCAISRLKRAYPTHIPVIVRTKRISGNESDGLFERIGDYYLITIDDRLKGEAKLETLTHEFAHVLEDNERWVNEDLHHCERFKHWQRELNEFMEG